jgi:hypothetical protein
MNASWSTNHLDIIGLLTLVMWTENDRDHLLTTVLYSRQLVLCRPAAGVALQRPATAAQPPLTQPHQELPPLVRGAPPPQLAPVLPQLPAPAGPSQRLVLAPASRPPASSPASVPSLLSSCKRMLASVISGNSKKPDAHVRLMTLAQKTALYLTSKSSLVGMSEFHVVGGTDLLYLTGR